jgi:hypothetical protein
LKTPSARAVLGLCLLLAAALSLPGLWMGLFMDDYFQTAIIEKLVPFGSIWSLFDFAPGNPDVLEARIFQGIFPWYTLPEMKARFFRPLSCLLAVADHGLFGRNYVAWHLHSVLWHLLLIAAYSLVARRVLPGAAGVLALVVFTLAPAHWFPVVWVANRNALVAVVPAMLGLYMHIRWREDAYKPGLPLSLLGYAAGLLGGEAALGVLAYVAAYELLAGQGPLPRRIRALAPAALVVVAYLAFYKLYGYGAYGSGSYIDPLDEPINYMAHAPARILMLLAAQFLGLSADLLVFAEWLRPVHVVAGLATVLVFGLAIRAAWPAFDPAQRRALKWMSAGTLLSMLPVAATFPTNRLLLAPSIGGSAILAILLSRWWQAWREGRAGKWITALAAVLILVHFVEAPAIWVGQSLAFTWFGHRVERACLDAELSGALPPGGHYVLLPGCDPVTSIYTPIIRAVLEKRRLAPEDFWLVTSQAPYDHRLATTGPNRFEIEVIDGSMLGSEFERLFRGSTYALRVGDRIKLDYVTVTVLDVGETGPSRIEFAFDRPLNDASLSFMAWKQGHVRKVNLPPVGQSTFLPWEKGLLAIGNRP